MDNHFTKEGLQLATFKLSLQNHAMLQTLTNCMSRLFTMMPENGADPQQMESLRKEFEQNCFKMSAIFELLATEHMADFAAEYDTSLDVITFQS